jgi:hypothetical protein
MIAAWTSIEQNDGLIAAFGVGHTRATGTISGW